VSDGGSLLIGLLKDEVSECCITCINWIKSKPSVLFVVELKREKTTTFGERESGNFLTKRNSCEQEINKCVRRRETIHT
jgi:hypothetical protein